MVCGFTSRSPGHPLSYFILEHYYSLDRKSHIKKGRREERSLISAPSFSLCLSVNIRKVSFLPPFCWNSSFLALAASVQSQCVCCECIVIPPPIEAERSCSTLKSRQRHQSGLLRPHTGGETGAWRDSGNAHIQIHTLQHLQIVWNKIRQPFKLNI